MILQHNNISCKNRFNNFVVFKKEYSINPAIALHKTSKKSDFAELVLKFTVKERF